MKRIIFIATFIIIACQLTFADKFELVSNMTELRCAGDFKAFKSLDATKNDFFDSIAYKAGRGSVFERIDDKTYTKDGKPYILVVFTKVTKTGSDFVIHEQVYFLPEDKNQPYYVKLKSGVDYGLLTLPFKLRSNPSTISPNATIGPYVGYKVAIGYHWTASFIGTFGLSGVALNDINSKEVENVLGFTYAGGIIFNLKSKFQVGFVVGSDFIGGDKGKNWTYEHKPWIALATGFTFLK